MAHTTIEALFIRAAGAARCITASLRVPPTDLVSACARTAIKCAAFKRLLLPAYSVTAEAIRAAGLKALTALGVALTITADARAALHNAGRKSVDGQPTAGREHLRDGLSIIITR